MRRGSLVFTLAMLSGLACGAGAESAPAEARPAPAATDAAGASKTVLAVSGMT